jgi:hypothetical protein
MATIKGGGKIGVVLAQIGEKVAAGGLVRVGFLEGATYPAKPTKELRAEYKARKKAKIAGAVQGASFGTLNVATVAAFNEFGTGTAPPRPFFRNMIKAKSKEWGPALFKQLKANDYDVNKSLAVLGEGISGQLRKSIRDTNAPPLAQSTIDRKGFSKPLVDTGHMLASIDYEVK